MAVVNQKGGVGKTTTAMNIIAYLTQAGKNCLLIDLDPQANATSGLGLNPAEIERGTYEVLIGAIDPHVAIQTIDSNGIRIVPSTISLAFPQP